jgi:hypothetical protein
LRAAIILVFAMTAGGACTKTTPAAEPTAPRDASPVAPAPAPESLESRVTKYWSLRQAKDLGAMYDLYSSEYRAKVSRTEFLKLSRLTRFDIVTFRVADVVADGDRATVGVAIKIVVPTLPVGEIGSVVKETWVREPDRNWYKLDEPLMLPFPRSLEGGTE